MILPVILAIPHTRRRFLPIMAATVGMSLLLAWAGCFSPGVGIQEQAPKWLVDVEVIYFIASNMIICLLVDQLNHAGLTTRTNALRTSQAGLAAATDRERGRIERDLHDGAQQRLVVIAMQLQVAQRLQRTDPEQAAALLGTLAHDVQCASAELRELSHGIYPPQLNDQGLPAALHAAVLRIPLPITLHCEQLRRYPPQNESAEYYSCQEGQQNTAKHAGSAPRDPLTLHDNPDGLTFDLIDTGTGCDPDTAHAGHGLRNITDRIGALGGTLTIDAHPGTGVHLHGLLPTNVSTPTAP
jgi:signal transduction histidine kinase